MNTTQTTAQQLADANEKVAYLEQAARHAQMTRNNAQIAKVQRDLVAAIAERDALSAKDGE